MSVILTNMLTNQQWVLPNNFTGGVLFMGAYPPGLYKIANGTTGQLPVRNGSQVQMVAIPVNGSVVYSNNENLRSWLQVGVDWAASGIAAFEALSTPPPSGGPPPGEGPPPVDEGPDGEGPDEPDEGTDEVPDQELPEEEPSREGSSSQRPTPAELKELLERARVNRRRRRSS